MALANFTLADVGVATPAFVPPSAAPLRVDLDDLLYAPDEYQSDAPSPPQQGINEPFARPANQQRRPKVRKRAGTAYLPPANQYTQYPGNPPQNPYQVHTQIYQNTRLDVQIEDQRIREVNTQYDNTGHYVHDPSGDYDYEQRRLNQNPQSSGYNPGYADTPYEPTLTSTPTSSRRFDGKLNQNVNNFNFNRPPSTTLPPRPPGDNTKTGGGGGSEQAVPERPRGFTKVESGSGGKTQLHAVLDYDDDEYYDESESGSSLRCYECTTGDDKSCADPYSKPKNHIRNCIMEDSQCGKFIVETAESDVVVRKCFDTFINCDTIIAKTKALTTNEKIKHCKSCHGDLCNGVSSASLSIPITILSLFVLQVIIYKLF